MSMNFREFAEEVQDRIKEFLPEKFQDADIRLADVQKNNGQVLTGLTILEEGTNAAPTIYLNQAFEDFQKGRPMEDILSRIAEVRVEHDMPKDLQGKIADLMGDKEVMKEQIITRLVNHEANEELLNNRPHKDMDDLSFIYQIDLSKQGMDGSIPITNDLMEKTGFTVEELHEAAMVNTPELMPLKMQTIEEALGMPVMFEDPAGPAMMVITNREGLNGAVASMYPGVEEKLHEQMGDFFILPSSTHEVLAVRKSPDMDIAMLKEMVTSINSSEVSPEERLSDNVYELKGGSLHLAKDAKERDFVSEKTESYGQDKEKPDHRERSAERDNGRGSVLQKLSEKKAEVAKSEVKAKEQVKNKTHDHSNSL